MMLQWIANYFYHNGYNYTDVVGYQKQEVAANRSRQNKSGSSNKNPQKVENATMKKGQEKKIGEGNKGYELIVKMGYQAGQGLGKDGNGVLEPLPLDKKADRKGLGASKPAVAAPPVKDSNKQDVQTSSSKRRRKRSKKAKARNEVELQARLATDQANVAQKAANKARKLATKAQKALDKLKVEITTATESKPKPHQHLPVRSLTATPIAKEEEDSKYLKDLLKRFHSEIELMQLRLEATESRNPECNDNDLIIAKIRVGNDETITERSFDFIRTELVGWIGMYQAQDMETPLFHAMTNNHYHITVVCDNNYAFQCLEHCIEEITKIRTVNGIRFFRLPRITPVVYCFDSAYEGVARDADLFLRQIHLHKPKLLTDYWIVVSHEVCTQKHKTYMRLLIDERSALAMDFQYSSKFCICLQMVIFHYCGIVTDEYLY